MCFRRWLSVRGQILGAAAILLFAALPGAAQSMPAAPPLAATRDHRFDSVHEDWTSPSLTKTHLQPVPPVTGSIAPYPAYTLQLLQLQWRSGDPIDLYVMKPKGVEKPPVILYLYGYPSDTDRFLDHNFQQLVTKDGFAAVGFVSALTGHRYHDRSMKKWFVSELPESLVASAHDIPMILDYLATRGDLDMSRVGMYAQGSGASIGILASVVDSRIQVLDTVDPWGDWPEWLANSAMVPDEERNEYLKPEFLKKVKDLDPVTWLPQVQAKKFRLQDVTYEPNTPKAAKEKLRQAVPKAPGVATIALYQTEEETKALRTGGKSLEWIEQQLRSLPAPPEKPATADAKGPVASTPPPAKQ